MKNRFLFHRAYYLIILISVAVFSGWSCGSSGEEKLSDILDDWEGLTGKKEFLASPYVTAGDRVYMVGHQDGTFPDLGWHVEGEMGGIWNHPIKLMDGFTAAVSYGGKNFCLDQADEFVNFPIANLHKFRFIPELEINRIQFVPEGQEGLVVEYELKNISDQRLELAFEFAGHTDLMPVWLGEEAGMLDHPDALEFDEKRNAWRGKDEGNEWFVLFGTGQEATHGLGESSSCMYNPQGKGAAARLEYLLDIKPNRTAILRFVVAGSYTSQQAAERTFDLIRQNATSLLKAKAEHYRDIASYAKINIPDKGLQQAFEWVKYNTEWLVRDVPELGRGLGAGMPDYPWWFGVDNEYTLKGAIATGRKDLVYQTIDLIHKLSEANGNGRIVHEVSTNGVVFNPGNINETPQFASLIWWVFCWTGDMEFLSKYYPTIQKGLEWLMEENDKDSNSFPDGYGMMEIHGLKSEMIDVAVYTWKAFSDAAQMAKVLGLATEMKAYQQTADQLKDKINKEFWVEDFNSYADFIGTTEEAIHLIEAAIVRADTLNKPWAVEELKSTRQRLSSYPPKKKQGFVVFHNWVVNTPMEMGMADSEKALAALDKARKFTNPFGVFVTGIDRDESAENEDGSFVGSKVFSYTGAVMTLPTGVSAIAENNYGRPDQALDYLQRMTRSFGFALPGSIYEVSPDYGMMAQAWNLYSFGVPIVTQFFGIQPLAHEKLIRIAPVIPEAWDNAAIDKVAIGDNLLKMSFEKTSSGLTLEIIQKADDWKVEIIFPKDKYFTWKLNGETVKPAIEKEHAAIVTQEKNIKLQLIL
jgi:glycogen debranching enzyme